MLIPWPADYHAVVILVAPHDRTAQDVYRRLLDALDIGEPKDDRTIETSLRVATSWAATS